MYIDLGNIALFVVMGVICLGGWYGIAKLSYYLENRKKSTTGEQDK